MGSDTPMMQQYRSLKERHRDAVLFFRMGDFYEMFESDAVEVSSILGLTLTKRNGLPMCGIPYHASGTYIPRLLRAGKKIAVCEQISLPESGKGIARREVVEVITPGTIVDEDFLDRSRNNYLAALGFIENAFSFTYIDLSTGEFAATLLGPDNRIERLRKELARLQPSELLIQETLIEEEPEVARVISEGGRILVNRFPDWSFSLSDSENRLKRLFGVNNLKGFGIAPGEKAIHACGVLLDYLTETSHDRVKHVASISLYEESDFVGLDESTQRNLEIVANMRDASNTFTLFQVLDKTRTASGARMLRSRLLHPLRDAAAIESRLNKVEELYRNQILLSSLRKMLSKVLDLERLSARIALGKAHAKDLAAAASTISAVLEIDREIGNWELSELRSLDEESRSRAKQLQEELDRSICDEPSILLTEGNMIRDGFSAELDRLRGMKQDSRRILNEYLEDEKTRSGISSLKIKYNKIIGHFIEVTKSNLNLVPDHFIRRQSLVGAERYTTERLGELETELNSASERIVQLEKELFLSLREMCAERIPLLQSLARHVCEIDFFQTLAYAATVHGYVRPRVAEGMELSIREGRHPVVEAGLSAGDFIPNSIEIGRKFSFALITGPNMAGKSTYLRQTALIVLMAQSGSFVPALEASIGIVDRIFCRVGASDNLARGESTFLVEMNETAYILRTASENSLVIMDEVGRGTSTTDGLSIAWAVSEALLSRKTKTLFATHFHELTTIEHKLMMKLRLAVREEGDRVIFLKRVEEGSAEGSYGIHVAALAGVPEPVLQRAREVLLELESRDRSISRELVEKTGELPSVKPGKTVSLFSETELIESELLGTDLNGLSPKQALDMLFAWKQRLGSEKIR
jgi:DNA mismatch repair protein MutS